MYFFIVAHNGQEIGLLDFSFPTFIPRILTNFSCLGQHPRYINIIDYLNLCSIVRQLEWQYLSHSRRKYISVPGHCFWYVLSNLLYLRIFFKSLILTMVSYSFLKYPFRNRKCHPVPGT